MSRRALVARAAARNPVWTAAAAGAVVGAVWLLGVKLLLEGTYALPLERPYVLLQEARLLADGDLPPAGHGLLWQGLLVPGAEVSGGAHAHLWVGLLSVGLLAAAAATAAWAARAVAGPGAAVPAVGLTLANGWFLYAALAGTEALLVALALVAAVGAAAAGSAAIASFALAALALTTPWGAIVAVVGATALASSVLRPFRPERLALLVPPLLGAAVAAREGLAPLLELEPTASVFRRPELTTAGSVSVWLGDASSAVSTLAVADAHYLVPVALATAALAGGALLWRRSPTAALVAASAALLAPLAAATTGWQTDNARVAAALVPVLALAAALALATLRPAIRTPAVVALIALTALPALGWWGDAIGGSSQLARVQLPFARETAANAAPGSRIAVDRPGVLNFYASVTLDLSGRETPALREPAHAGLGAVWEALERLPAEHRPELLAISLDRVAGLAPTGFVGRPFIERRIPYEEERQPDTTHVLTLYAAEWESTGRAAQPPSDIGARLAETAVDIGDTDSESQAEYERAWNVRAPDRSAEIPLVTRRASGTDQMAVSEGCRLVVRESFVLDLRPNAVLVARFDGEADIAVRVGDRLVGRLRAAPSPEAFSYAQVRLPMATDRRRISLESESERAYMSCRYWLAV